MKDHSVPNIFDLFIIAALMLIGVASAIWAAIELYMGEPRIAQAGLSLLSAGKVPIRTITDRLREAFDLTRPESAAEDTAEAGTAAARGKVNLYPFSAADARMHAFADDLPTSVDETRMAEEQAMRDVLREGV